MFAFSAEVFLNELAVYSPAIASLFERLESAPSLLHERGVDIIMSSRRSVRSIKVPPKIQ